MGRRGRHRVGGTLRAPAKAYGFSLKTPWRKLPLKVRKLVLEGSEGEELRFEFKLKKGSSWVHHGTYEGVLNNLERRYRETSSEGIRRWIGSLMNPTPCPDCGGRRLKPESLAVRIEGRSIAEWSALSRSPRRAAIWRACAEGGAVVIAEPILSRADQPSQILDDVGLGYLSNT